MSECLFCRIGAGEIPAEVVWEGEDVIAFRDIEPVAPTHVLVIPRAHHASAASLAAEDPGLLARVVSAAGAVAEAEGIAQSGYRVVSNVGPDAGQQVFHVHLHVLGGENLGAVVGPRG